MTGLELLRVAHKVNVESVGVLQCRVDDIEVVDDVTEVGGEDELEDHCCLGGQSASRMLA